MASDRVIAETLKLTALPDAVMHGGEVQSLAAYGFGRKADEGNAQSEEGDQDEGRRMELTARIHIEDGSYWAEVPGLPGCFAAGDTLDELFESLREGVALYLADRPLRAA